MDEKIFLPTDNPPSPGWRLRDRQRMKNPFCPRITRINADIKPADASCLGFGIVQKTSSIRRCHRTENFGFSGREHGLIHNNRRLFPNPLSAPIRVNSRAEKSLFLFGSQRNLAHGSSAVAWVVIARQAADEVTLAFSFTLFTRILRPQMLLV